MSAPSRPLSRPLLISPDNHQRVFDELEVLIERLTEDELSIERLVVFKAGVYERPLRLKSGVWRLCLEELDHKEAQLDERPQEVGAALQWRGRALEVGPNAKVNIEALSLHARCEPHVNSSPSALERPAALMCEGQLTLRGGSISAAHAHAIWLKGGATLSLTGVRLHHSGRCGLYVEGPSLKSPAHATVRCEGCHFELNGVDQMTLEGEAQEEETDGVWLDGALSAEFEGCFFTKNQGDGLYMKSGRARVLSCHFEANGVNGLYAGEQATLEVEGSALLNSLGAGAGVKGGALTLRRCELRGGEGVGFFAIEGASLKISEVSCEGHKGGGGLILKASSGAVELYELTCSHNKQSGLLIEQSEAVRLTALTLSYNHPSQLLCTRSTLKLQGARITGGRVGFGVEGGRVELCDVQLEGSSEVGVVLTALEGPSCLSQGSSSQGSSSQGALEFTHQLNKLSLSLARGVGLLMSGPIKVSLEGLHVRELEPAEAYEGAHPPEVNTAQALDETLTCLELSEGGELTMRGGVLRGGGVGARVLSGAHLSADDVTFVAQREVGVLLREGASLTAKACKILRQGQRDLDELEAKEVSVTKPSAQRLRMGAGLWALNAKLSLISCELRGQSSAQCVVLGHSEAHLEGCLFYRGGDAALLAASGAHVTLSGGLMEGQRGAALWLEGASLKASELEVRAQGSGGLFAREGSSAELSDCRFQGQAKAIILSERGSALTLTRCELRDGLDAGVLIEEGGEVRLSGGLLQGLNLVSVVAQERSKLSLEGVEVSGGAVGVLALAGSEGEVRSCWIYGQTQAELLVHAQSKLTVEDNSHQSLEELFEGPKH